MPTFLSGALGEREGGEAPSDRPAAQLQGPRRRLALPPLASLRPGLKNASNFGCRRAEGTGNRAGEEEKGKRVTGNGKEIAKDKEEGKGKGRRLKGMEEWGGDVRGREGKGREEMIGGKDSRE